MDAKLTQDELQAIKERAEKASAGEWKTDEHRVYSESIDGDYICEIWSSFDDAEFIAASRQDIPKLVTEVERLEQRIFTARKMAEVGDKYGSDLLYAEILEVLNGGIDI